MGNFDWRNEGNPSKPVVNVGSFYRGCILRFELRSGNVHSLKNCDIGREFLAARRVHERNRAQGVVHFTVSDSKAGSARLSTNQIGKWLRGDFAKRSSGGILGYTHGRIYSAASLDHPLRPSASWQAEGGAKGTTSGR